MHGRGSPHEVVDEGDGNHGACRGGRQGQAPQALGEGCHGVGRHQGTRKEHVCQRKELRSAGKGWVQMLWLLLRKRSLHRGCMRPPPLLELMQTAGSSG